MLGFSQDDIQFLENLIFSFCDLLFQERYFQELGALQGLVHIFVFTFYFRFLIYLDMNAGFFFRRHLLL